jgi:hypothetical protein
MIRSSMTKNPVTPFPPERTSLAFKLELITDSVDDLNITNYFNNVLCKRQTKNNSFSHLNIGGSSPVEVDEERIVLRLGKNTICRTRRYKSAGCCRKLKSSTNLFGMAVFQYICVVVLVSKLPKTSLRNAATK